MHNRLIRFGVPGFIFSVLLASFAQDLDSNVTSVNRNTGNVADEIGDNGERSAFLLLYEKGNSQRKLDAARAFIEHFPQSAFLAQAFETAARTSFDEEDYNEGLAYAAQALALLPENPLLLVTVADVQARKLQDDAAIANARNALSYFDRFARPGSIPEHDWPDVKRRQQAIAYFVMGRAELHKGLKEPAPELRRTLLAESVDSLKQARSLRPADEETTYLLGVAYLSSGNPMPAASEFASVYMQGGVYAPKALDALQQMYDSIPWGSKSSFDSFLNQAEHARETGIPEKTAAESNGGSLRQLPDYAGSKACKECHAEIYRDWAQTGMARMLQPYSPQNVIGDFTRSNEYYTGEDTEYLHGKFTTPPSTGRKLFARMVLRNGRHYFDIRQSDGQWHSYPVDYTIGSKWQQAYATTLPNGEIHVFPIQYNVREKKWLNYWKSLDGHGTERSDPYNFEKLDNSTNYDVACATCHTSQLRTTTIGNSPGTDDFEFREPGVGCEMCHGPSAQHIASMIKGAAYDKGPLDPPVDFEKISNREFVNICAQCHMQSAMRDPGPNGELNYSRTGTFFRQDPSIPFDEFRRRGFYKDGRFAQTTFIVEALERSKCFRKGQVSCGSCHDPHGHDFSTNFTSLKFQDQPDRMCTGCHARFADKQMAAAHTHHPSDSEGSRCVSCHMPRIMDALAFEARTHRIDDIPNAEMTLRFGQQESPNACLLCHKEKSAKWVQSELLSWKTGTGSRAPLAVSAGNRAQ